MTSPFRLIVASIVLALAPAVALSFAPAVSESSTFVVVGPETTVAPETVPPAVRQRSLPETQGRGVLLVLFFPAAVAAVPLGLARTRIAEGARVVAAVILWGCCLLGALSIGLFYFPAAIAMLAAAAVSDRPALVPQPPRARD